MYQITWLVPGWYLVQGWYRDNFINMAADMLALIVISYIVPDYQKGI
jgi:hypothetical protein